MKNTILFLIFVTFISSTLFADTAITRGTDIGEIYFLTPTVTQPAAIYRSIDFGETATCMDSTLDTGMLLERICADITSGVVYGHDYFNLYISNNYGQEGSWIFRSSDITYSLNSGVSEGFLYDGFWQHSEDYGFSYIQHSYNGYFGSSSISEIDFNQNIGYIRSTVGDSLYFFISYDNFENLEVQNVFNYNNTPIGLLTRGYQSGEIFTLGGINSELRFTNNFGQTWELKNTFNCPNLPIKGIVGGRQPGELFMIVEYVQLLSSIKYTYIYHSLDYGETFTIYAALEFGSEPYYANFFATPDSGNAPLPVQFTDISSGEGELTWEWDFDDDGIVDSYEQNPEYTYQDSGLYRVTLQILNGMYDPELIASKYIHVSGITGIDNEEIIENGSSILQNYPNPFNPSTIINYRLPMHIEKTKIEIYNLKGQLVDEIAISCQRSSVNWNAEDFSSGIYLYKLDVKNSPIKKMMLLK